MVFTAQRRDFLPFAPHHLNVGDQEAEFLSLTSIFSNSKRTYGPVDARLVAGPIMLTEP